MVIDSQQHQDTPVRAFLADLPAVFELIGPIGGVIAIQILHRDNGELRVRFRVVELAAQAIELCHSLWRKNMGKVADVIGGLWQVLDLLCLHGGNKRWND